MKTKLALINKTARIVTTQAAILKKNCKKYDVTYIIAETAEA